MFKKLIFATILTLTSVSSFATQYITNGTFNEYPAESTNSQTGWTTTSNLSFFFENRYFEGSQSVPGTLSQSISGATGALTLSLDLLIYNYSATHVADPRTYESVIFDGVTLGTYNLAGEYSLSFNVIGTGSDTLVFEGRNPPYFNAISNISLINAAVPEPSSYLLMALGLGLVGFTARRKQS